MRKFLRSARPLVCLVAAAMVLNGVPAASTGQPSSLQGRILDTEGAPVPSATVLLSEVESEEAFSSAPTGDDGNYSLEGVPKGIYHLAIQTERGLFPSQQSLELDPETPRVYYFRLQESAGAQEDGGAGAGPHDPPAGTEKKKRRKGVPFTFWVNPLTVALAGVAIVIVTSELVEEARGAHDDDDEDRDASPKSP